MSAIPAHNVIPAIATAKFNIRFNPNHTGDDLMERLRQLIGAGTSTRHASISNMRVSGEAFYTEPGKLTDLIVAAVKAETGRSPHLQPVAEPRTRATSRTCAPLPNWACGTKWRTRWMKASRSTKSKHFAGYITACWPPISPRPDRLA